MVTKVVQLKTSEVLGQVVSIIHRYRSSKMVQYLKSCKSHLASD